MLTWLRSAFDRLAGGVTVLRNVNVSEISEAFAATNQLRLAATDCDWSCDADVGSVIDKALAAAREWADVSATELDDRIVDEVGEITTANRQWLVEAIHYLAGTEHQDCDAERQAMRAFAASNQPAFAASGEPDAKAGSVTVWIELALLLWSVIRPFVRK